VVAAAVTVLRRLAQVGQVDTLSLEFGLRLFEFGLRDIE
jgi:hypothetical protein